MSPISIDSYYDLLDKHDWYHDFSDDILTYRQGMLERTKLLEMSDQSPKHRSLFYEFAEYYYTGAPWAAKQKPKPRKEGL